MADENTLKTVDNFCVDAGRLVFCRSAMIDDCVFDFYHLAQTVYRFDVVQI